MRKRRDVIFFDEESLTKQCFKDDCDINLVMQKWVKHGIEPNLEPQKGFFGDFTDVADYMTACNLVIEAQESFASLDSKVRERFANDPSKFLEFMSNFENLEEAVSLGLAVKRPENSSVVSDEERLGV